jgi:peptidoglycan hydrolase-like protein with peptidoglycan-binding domain
VVVLHVTASNADSQYAYFNTHHTACSHFHVAASGKVEQYIDTDHLSAADVEGSNDAISIETQGLDADGHWSAAQETAIIGLLAWLHTTHDIPLRLIRTSKVGETGIGWHRIGIDGNFPALPSILAGRLQRGGGEHWSTSFGKSCPGDNRIARIPHLVSMAAAVTRDDTASRGDDRTPVAKRPHLIATVQRDSRGAAVELVQKRLGFTGSDVDGVFGPKTDAAVKEFQRDHKTAQDGIVDAHMWVWFLHDSDGRLKVGDNNQAVRVLQHVVQVKPDGKFGPITKAAVQDVQAYLKVTPDGVFGPRSRDALLDLWT